MWVLRRIPKEETSWDQLSPWKGCLHIDKNGRAWYATDLAKPTQIVSQQDAEECSKIIGIQFLDSEIQVALYEDVFQKPLPLPVPPIIMGEIHNNTVVEINNWNWNDEESVPF